MKVISDSSKADEVMKLMKEKGIIIFFFMNNCGHCEATRPAWTQLSQSGLPYQFAEVESAAVSPQTGILGFPHFHLVEKNGKVRKVDGEKTNISDLAKSLGIKLKKGGASKSLRRAIRRNTLRLSRRVRKVLHGTK
jgi:hypothetical protein